jgi:hypothetical protein
MFRFKRASIRLLTPALAAALALACGDVRSLAPALDATHAESRLDLLGRWEIPDTATLEIRPDSGHAPRLIFRFQDLASSAERGTARAVKVLSFEAHVGRLAGRNVIEFTPATRDDPTLRELVQSYNPLLTPAYAIIGFDLRGDELRLAALAADSAERRAPEVLRRPGCRSPYYIGADGDLVLTGTSREARAAYACLIRAWGFEDAVVYRRVR